MNKLKTLASAVAFAAAASSASAITLVVDFSGTVDTYTSPANLQDLTTLALQQQYVGQVVIRDYNNGDIYQYNRDKGHYEGQVANVNFDNNDKFGFTFGSERFGYFEGQRGFIPNPNFDGSKPSCSQSSFDRGDCAELNQSYIRLGQNGANFGSLLGNANATFDEFGNLKSVNWTMNREAKLNPDFDPSQPEGRRNSKYRNSISSFDGLLENNGFTARLNEVSLSLTNFEVIEQNHEFIYLKANTQSVSVDVVNEVPVPAAAWLFGSAMLGLAGLKRRK